jgi:two-component system, OmpR family, response regulator PrrA
MTPFDEPTVLVVDDEPNVRDMLEIGLTHHGFSVQCAGDGAQALALLRAGAPDAILLDVMMPKIDGVSLVPLIRRITEAPIVMLSALSDAQDKIAGLAAGADDYVGKPFDLGEVAARLRAQLRRPQLAKRDVIRYADVVVDVPTRRVETAAGPVELTAREFDLLVTFLREPGRIFTRDQLLDRVWGRDAAVEPNVVETYVSYLRGKLGAQGPRPLIRTIRRVGYTARVD